MKSKKYLFIIIVLLITSCDYLQKKEYKRSSFKPLSVSYDLRINEFEKENLIKNSSFEKGKLTDTIDTLNSNFHLRKWEIVGEKVEWVNLHKSKYDSSEVSKGNYAIKITRTKDDIKEINNEAYGILSDYIKVIPGNYLFFFDIKLENIYPAVKRLNSKIGTDIDIQIIFYDYNKQKMSSGIYYEYMDREIDNGFKGFAFSNFYYIDKFDWGKVRGRTLNYPFSEGDIPDGCRYVKIFLGLKGTGTMWVDNIDFRFSKWNFTSLERIKPFFEEEYPKTAFIIPTPQHIGEVEKIDMKNKNAVIIIPDKPTNADISAEKLLINKLDEHFKLIDTILIRQSNNYKLQDSDIVFCIGKNDFYNQHYINIEQDSLTNGKKQAYKIKRIDNKIFLTGETEIGNYYATTTLVQLFDSTTHCYHHADITDYPDFEGRSTLTKHYRNEWTVNNDTSLSEEEKQKEIAQLFEGIDYENSLVDYYAFYKINKIYNNYASLGKKWWEPGEYFSLLFENLNQKCSELGVINTCVMLNPYFHFGYETEEQILPDSLRDIFSHSKKEDLQKILDVYKIALDGGANTIMLCADDFIPHAGTTRGEYSLFTNQDKEQFYNIANAQNYMLNHVQKWLAQNYDEVRFELCPAPYLNQFIDYSMGSAEAFFRDLTSHLPEDIAIIWTGNTVRSLSYDEADIRRYSSHIKRKPMLWDNTPYARALEGEYGGYPAHYPGKSVMCSLFEPYDIIVPDNFSEVMDSHIYSNLGGSGEFYKIKYTTFADFTWNTKDYNPDFSLFKTLVSQYGKEQALLLLEFNDIYFKIVAIWAKTRNSLENQTTKKTFKIQEREIERGNSLINSLSENFSQIKEKIHTNNKLLHELEEIMNKKSKQFQEIIKDDNVEVKNGNRQT